MTEPTQEQRDAWSARVLEDLRPHYERLRREQVDYHWELRQCQVVVPSSWDRLNIGPKIGQCFGMDVVTGSVRRPVVRPVPDERIVLVVQRPEVEAMLEVRLGQRTAALGRVAAENELLRASLLRVLDLTDDEGILTVEEVHDAIGSDVIIGLKVPPLQVERPAPRTAEAQAEALGEYRRAGLFERSVTPQSIVDDILKNLATDVPAGFVTERDVIPKAFRKGDG